MTDEELDDALAALRPDCDDCGNQITGCSWNGRCLDCHEARLLPIPPEGADETGETWSDIYVAATTNHHNHGRNRAVTEPTYELADIDPAYAKELLDLNNHNRNLRPRVVTKYATDMANGDWQGQNGQTVVLDNDGRIVDGQHRLHAIIESDTTQRMMVVWGVPMSAQLNVDTQAKRSYSDQLKLDGEPNSTVLASVIRQVHLWQAGERRAIGNGNRVPSNSQLMATLQQHPELRETANQVNRVRKLIRAPGAVVGLCHWLFSGIDYDDADHFFAMLRGDHDGLERGHPVRTLLEAANSQKGLSRTILTAYFIKAWNAYRDGNQVMQLKFRAGGASPESFPEPR